MTDNLIQPNPLRILLLIVLFSCFPIEAIASTSVSSNYRSGPHAFTGGGIATASANFQTLVSVGVAAETAPAIAGRNILPGYIPLLDLDPPPAVTPLYPPAMTETTTRQPTFIWSAATDSWIGVEHTIFELSTDSNFSTIALRTDINDTQYVPVLIFPNDTYYWRLRVRDRQGNIGPASAARMVIVSALSGQNPIARAVIDAIPSQDDIQSQLDLSAIGLIFTADILVDSVTALDSYTLTVRYPATLLALLDQNGRPAREGPFLSSKGSQTSFAASRFGSASIRLQGQVDSGGVSGGGVVATLQFQTINIGTGDISFDSVIFRDTSSLSDDRSMGVNPGATITVAGLAPNLNGVTVFPNPYDPNSGNPDFGRPYDGSFGSGITFLNLTNSVRIEIFTITGQKVAARQSVGSPQYQWDVRNDAGQRVVSGLYIYSILDLNTNQRITGKLVILR